MNSLSLSLPTSFFTLFSSQILLRRGSERPVQPITRTYTCYLRNYRWIYRVIFFKSIALFCSPTLCAYTSCQIAVYNVIQNAIQTYGAEFDSIYTGFKINSNFTKIGYFLATLIKLWVSFLLILEESLIVALFTNLVKSVMGRVIGWNKKKNAIKYVTLTSWLSGEMFHHKWVWMFWSMLVSNCIKSQNQEKLMFSKQRVIEFHCSNLKGGVTVGKKKETLP